MGNSPPKKFVAAADVVLHPDITCYEEAVLAELALYPGGPGEGVNRLIGYTRAMTIMVAPHAKFEDGSYMCSSNNLSLEVLGWTRADMLDSIEVATPGVALFFQINSRYPDNPYRHTRQIYDAASRTLLLSALARDNVLGVSFIFISKIPLSEVSVSVREYVAGPTALRQHIAGGRQPATGCGRLAAHAKPGADYSPTEFLALFEPPFSAERRDAYVSRLRATRLAPGEIGHLIDV